MILEVKELTVMAGHQQIFVDMNLVFRTSALTALMGRNGSGKTSFLQVLAGLVKPVKGKVYLDGLDLRSFSTRERARLIGILVQDESDAFFGSTWDYVALARIPWTNGWRSSEKDVRIVSDSLHLLGLDNLVKENYRLLSAGERQRARIAQLLAQDTQVLLLDEPLQNLDVDYQGRVMKTLALKAGMGVTILSVLHDVYWAQNGCSDALLLFGEGNMKMGVVRDVLIPSNLHSLYGVAFVPVQTGDAWLVPQK
ncbi:MAG: ABC transporter ATP-binding protein [Pseudomonadota bacterium]|nr:ABC transporter ATP-binding protein [Pseudomonadota bacterium]